MRDMVSVFLSSLPVLSLPGGFILALFLTATPVSIDAGPAVSSFSSPESLYGETDPARYLSGRYSPQKHSHFVSLKSLGLPVRDSSLYLRKEAARALQRMYRDFRREHPEVPFWIQSATRSWYYQRGIWERKWSGQRRVEGVRLDRAYPDALERAKKILEYSSMPGTSRHHWGSDFDLNRLTNSYYKQGEGAVLYGWLRENAKKYGFCQPYSADRSVGYNEERWHWSYRPLAAPLLHEWIKRFGARPELSAGEEQFKGQKRALSLAPVYVKSVSQECM